MSALDETLRGRGVRMAWAELPLEVRRGIEGLLGAEVVEANSQQGGFSPGVAARVTLSDGRRAFVKAVSSAANPEAPEMHRREAVVAAALPASVAAAKLLASYDEHGWVVLAFENIEGGPPQLPWRNDELERVLDAIVRLADTLTPTPLALPVIAEVFDPSGFEEIRSAAASERALEELDPWVVHNLDRLAEAEARWSEATVGDTLLHFDLRADNVLLTQERVLFVDWPHATVGAAWIDLLGMLPSVAMQGGPPPWELFERHPAARHADPAAVDAALAGLAGFFLSRGLRPDPPGLPTVRRFQRAQAAEAVRWLRQRAGRT
jgi:aminoglycoside phosphotransferase (APT) family kinase protein